MSSGADVQRRRHAVAGGGRVDVGAGRSNLEAGELSDGILCVGERRFGGLPGRSAEMPAVSPGPGVHKRVLRHLIEIADPIFWSLRERMSFHMNQHSSSFHHVRVLAVLRPYLLAMRSQTT